MAVEPNKNQNNLNPQDSGEVGGNKKLYAGKFESVEALEKSYMEAEKGFHEVNQVRQEMKQMRELLESRLNPTEGDEYGRGGGNNYTTVVDPRTDTAASNGSQTLTRFYTDPDGFLRERDERVISETERRLSQRHAKEEELRGRIVTWNGQNPDVAQFPDLLEYWVKRTDGRLSPESRLDQAAAKVRERLIELRKGRSESDPNPGDHVEEPNSEGNSPRVVSQTQNQSSDPESELKSYVANRNAFIKTKRLGSARS